MFPENVLKYAPWSYSMANMATNCPLAFYKRYIAHEPSAEPESASSILGKAVHTVLEIIAHGGTLDMAYKRTLDLYDLTYDMTADLKTYRDAIKAFAKGLTVLNTSVDRQFVEAKFAIDKEFKNISWGHKGVVLRGKIDLVLVTKGKLAITIDHKSGKVQDITKHAKQLECYNVLIDAKVPDLNTFKSGIHAVGESPKANGTRTVWLDEVPVETVRSRFRERVINFLTEAADSAETRSSHKGWLCGFCGFKPVCPEYT